MDQILDEFETWPGRIICLELHPLIVEKNKIGLYRQHNFFNFDWILKLADMVDMNEVLDKFEKVWKLTQSDRVTSLDS